MPFGVGVLGRRAEVISISANAGTTLDLDLSTQTSIAIAQRLQVEHNGRVSFICPCFGE